MEKKETEKPQTRFMKVIDDAFAIRGVMDKPEIEKAMAVKDLKELTDYWHSKGVKIPEINRYRREITKNGNIPFEELREKVYYHFKPRILQSYGSPNRKIQT